MNKKTPEIKIEELASDKLELDHAEILRLLKSETGFSAELKALEKLLALNVATDASVYYRDPDTDIAREIDLVCTFEQKLTSEHSTCASARMLLVCDVKSSITPTVVFSSPPSQPEKSARFYSKVFWVDSEIDLHEADRRDFGSIEKFPRVGRVVVQVNTHTSKQDKNRINSDAFKEATFSSAKASKYFLDQQRDDIFYYLLFERNPVCEVFSAPVVIINGPLYEYYFDKDGEHLSEIGIIPVRHSLATSGKEKNQELSVDNRMVIFCAIDSIPSLVSSSRKWLKDHSHSYVGKSIKETKDLKEIFGADKDKDWIF